MAKKSLWHDEYWLPLMQLYLQRPQGVKATYSKGLVDLALELHIAPGQLHQRMLQLQQLGTPRLEMLWQRYAEHPSRLARTVKLMRQMKGFGTHDAFYDGVEVNESWERWFKPLPASGGKEPLTPAKLVMILDLYFRLVPATMVPETPEIIDLARRIRSTPAEIADVMDVFRCCDPQLSREDFMIHPLLNPCMKVWKQYGNMPPGKLAAFAKELGEYFK
jgi:hypothetical protein